MLYSTNLTCLQCLTLAIGLAMALPSMASDDLIDRIEADFINPPNEYRLVQYGLAEWSLERYPTYGIGGFMAFFHGELYQSGDEGPERIGPLVDAAFERNMPVWLADDFGYPSGMAGGRVVEENPEFEVRGLTRLAAEGQGESTVAIDLPEDAERFVHAVRYPMVDGTPDFAQGETVAVEPNRVEATGSNGDWRLDAFALVIRDRDTQAQSTMEQFGHSGRYPDLMNADAMERFIAHMHAPILERIEDPATKVEGFYTNEPNLMQLHWTPEEGPFACLPWNAGLPERFQEMHGYDVLPLLGALFEGEGLDARRVRMHFHQTVAEALTDSFARQIADWCTERGIASSGHFLLNEYLSMHVACYGDLMKFASEFHVPALDIGIPNPDRFGTFPYQQTRFFSSIASWKEHDRVILLLDPIIAGGGLQRLSPAMPLLLNSTNMAFFHGANLFTSYKPLDARPDGSATGYTEEEYRAFNEYIGRIARVLRGARRETSIALYYPIAMFQADYRPSNRHWPQVAGEYRDRQEAWDRTEAALLDGDLDYHIVHPEAVADATIRDGVMTIGSGSFRYLIMPQMEVLPLAILEQIEAFEAGGGTVLWVDAKPEAGAYAHEDAVLAQHMDGVATVPVENLTGIIERPYDAAFDLSFAPGPTVMPVARFSREGKRIYYLVNRSGEHLEAEVTAERSQRITVLDPVTGAITDRELPTTIEIDAFNSMLIMM